MARALTWATLLVSLYDRGPDQGHPVPGMDLLEWMQLVQHDYDDIDKMLIDLETIGA